MLRIPHSWNLAVAALFALLASATFMYGQNQKPTDTCLRNCASDQFSPNESSDGVRELMQTLSTAYQNSVMHDAPNTDLETGDLRLENASIDFSLRMLDEIGKGVCQSSDPATPSVVEHACALNDELAGLNDLTDSLSYAAYRLEMISESSSRAGLGNSEQTAILARVGSMEHLYRMVFALSHTYLDSTQTAVYLQAADEQLQLARSSIENERALSASDPAQYAMRLQELSQLGDRITYLRGGASLQ